MHLPIRSPSTKHTDILPPVSFAAPETPTTKAATRRGYTARRTETNSGHWHCNARKLEMALNFLR